MKISRGGHFIRNIENLKHLEVDYMEFSPNPLIRAKLDIKKGYLAATSVYVCTEHTPEVVDAYFEELDPVFAQIKECESGQSVDNLLEGPVCHSGFKRLN